MKAGIHPEYVEAKVTCSCGNTFTTRSTLDELHVELCNECHPFYTGKQKLVDSGGRVERFQRRYGRKSFTAAEEGDKPAKPAPKAEAPEAKAPKAEAPEAEAPEAEAPKAEAPKAEPEPVEAESTPEPAEA